MSSHGIATRNNTSIWRRLLPSSTSIIIFTLLLISLFMNGALQPYKRGFFCNDSTIQYPHKPDTFSFKLLLLIAFFIPAVVIKFIQFKVSRLKDDCSLRPRSKSSQYLNDTPKGSAEEEKLMETTDTVKKRLVVNDDDSDLEVCDDTQSPLKICDKFHNESGNVDRLNSDDFSSFQTKNRLDNQDEIVREDIIKYRMTEQSRRKKTLGDVHIFSFGFTATAFLAGIGKMAGGRLRPHFMQRCMPNIDCTLLSNTNRYIEDFECTNKMLRPRDYYYITTSWPSGKISLKIEFL